MKSEVGILLENYQFELFKMTDKAFNAMLAINYLHASKCTIGTCIETVVVCDRVQYPYATLLDMDNKMRIIPIGEIKINSNAETITVVPYWSKMTQAASKPLLSEYNIKDLYSCGFGNVIIDIYNYLRWHYRHEETLENTF